MFVQLVKEMNGMYSLRSKIQVIPRILESQSLSSLTKTIERITKIYEIK
jgi:hypothetical protein